LLSAQRGNPFQLGRAQVAGRGGAVMSAEKKGAAGLAPNGTSHEFSETIGERSVNNSGVVFFERGKAVLAVNGWRETAFDAEPPEILAYLTQRERTTFELRTAVLRYIAGIDLRSFEEIGAELGVGRAGVSRVYRDVLARIGARGIFNNAEKRWKLAEAAKRTLNSRKAA
jgi:hypothetical protein